MEWANGKGSSKSIGIVVLGWIDVDKVTALRYAVFDGGGLGGKVVDRSANLFGNAAGLWIGNTGAGEVKVYSGFTGCLGEGFNLVLVAPGFCSQGCVQ